MGTVHREMNGVDKETPSVWTELKGHERGQTEYLINGVSIKLVFV